MEVVYDSMLRRVYDVEGAILSICYLTNKSWTIIFWLLSRIEFPYPKETPFKDKTAVIKDTNNPEYKHKIMIPVNVKEKACQRVFKRGAAKIEVWSKGGFLRGDTLLGTAAGIMII